MRWLIALLFVAAAVHAAPDEGNLIFLSADGSTNISQLSLRVIPGQTNATSFRIVAQGGNVSSAAIFALSTDLNVTVTPSNRTFLPDGDFQIVSVTVGVANDTTAGFRVASVMVLTTKPQQLLLPLIVEIPSTTEWNVSTSLYSKNVSVREFGIVNVTLSNTGNIPILGHVSVVDLNGMVSVDDSDFLLQPGIPLHRPIYYFLPDIRPGTYAANITFVDSLSNTRRVLLNFSLPDQTPPVVNVSLGRTEIYPSDRVSVTVRASDDVNVSTVRYRLGTGNVSVVSAAEPGVYVFELSQMPVGTHNLVVITNDTSDNLATREIAINVSQYRYFNASPTAAFGTFKPNPGRGIVIGKALSPVDAIVTLTSLSMDLTVDTSVNISLNGQRLDLNAPRSFALSGDLILEAKGELFTRFGGTLQMKLPDDVYNPAPTITFTGRTANYSITPAFNVSTPGFAAIQVCVPREGATLEASKLACATEFPADTPQEQVAVVGSPASLAAEREGYRNQIETVTRQRNDSQAINWLFVAVCILIFIVWIVKSVHFDQILRR